MKYRHIGTHALVLDVGRDEQTGYQLDRHIGVGEIFDADLAPEVEDTLIRSNAITRVEPEPSKTRTAKASAEES